MNQSSIPYPIEFILRMIGIWPGIFNDSIFLTISALITFCLIFQFLNAILVYRDLILLMSSLCATTAETMFFIKFLTLRGKYWYVTNILSNIIDDCKEIKTEKDENMILEKLRWSYLFFVCTSCIYLSTGAFFVLTAAASYNTENREFILDSTFPFDAYKSPIFEIIFVIQFLTTFLTSIGNGFIDSLFVMLVLHAGAKIDMVRGEISNFSKILRFSDNKKLRETATMNLVDKYQATIEFTEKIECIYSYQLLVQVALSILAICATGFSFIALDEYENSEEIGVTKRMKFILFLMSGLWITGVYCTGGDYIRNKNELIQYDIFSCEWYEFQSTECKTLWIIMIRSQRPMTITAGKFLDLTLYTYTNIVKTSATYLSVLRAVY